MQTNTSESIKVGLFFLLGASLIYVLYETLTKITFYQETGYVVKAVFSDLKQLKVGDDVRLSGVRIGSVNLTKLEEDLAVASLNIENSFTIPKDSVATITTAGLLGSNYVSISPGKSKKNLNPKDRIQTQYTPDLSSVIGQFGQIGSRITSILSSVEDYLSDEDSDSKDKQNVSLESTNIKQTEGKTAQTKPKKGNLFSNLSDFFSTNRPKLDKIITNIDTITQKMASGEGTIGKLISEDTAYSDLLAMFDKIKIAAENANKMFDDIKSVTQSVKSGDGLLSSLISDKEIKNQFSSIIKNINDFSGKLNSSKSTIGRLVSDDSLYKHAENTLNKIEKATDNMINSGPITAVGVASQALF